MQINQLVEKIAEEKLALAVAAVEQTLTYQEYLNLATQYQGMNRVLQMIEQGLEEEATRETEG